MSFPTSTSPFDSTLEIDDSDAESVASSVDGETDTQEREANVDNDRNLKAASSLSSVAAQAAERDLASAKAAGGADAKGLLDDGDDADGANTDEDDEDEDPMKTKTAIGADFSGKGKEVLFEKTSTAAGPISFSKAELLSTVKDPSLAPLPTPLPAPQKLQPFKVVMRPASSDAERGSGSGSVEEDLKAFAQTRETLLKMDLFGGSGGIFGGAGGPKTHSKRPSTGAKLAPLNLLARVVPAPTASSISTTQAPSDDPWSSLAPLPTTTSSVSASFDDAFVGSPVPAPVTLVSSGFDDAFGFPAPTSTEFSAPDIQSAITAAPTTNVEASAFPTAFDSISASDAFHMPSFPSSSSTITSSTLAFPVSFPDSSAHDGSAIESTPTLPITLDDAQSLDESGHPALHDADETVDTEDTDPIASAAAIGDRLAWLDIDPVFPSADLPSLPSNGHTSSPSGLVDAPHATNGAHHHHPTSLLTTADALYASATSFEEYGKWAPGEDEDTEFGASEDPATFGYGRLE
ncbi:hypothetical protein HDU93_004842 [Gonapodya sp. JEL0774]|nr:hypothetical protein HDU93_004842 [Gonapodya sp. JEL0774]